MTPGEGEGGRVIEWLRVVCWLIAREGAGRGEEGVVVDGGRMVDGDAE